MLDIVVWNIICTHSIIPNVFSVGFFIYSVARSIHHKHYTECWIRCAKTGLRIQKRNRYGQLYIRDYSYIIMLGST